VRLIALEVETFKKVRHALVTFGPRVTVLHGPNELGKSTLAEALHAALLIEVTKKEGEAFIPWDAPAGRARVTLTFEVDGARYRVDKTFGARPKSVLERAELSPPSTYRLLVEGRGVDGRLRELLSWGVPAPATRRASRKATSFLVTALLGQQGRAADIFEASLATDEINSGRARVTQALGAMGRDPTVEALLAKLEPRVLRSFTETGRPRQTSDAPLVQAREKWSQSEDELQRLKEKDAVATEIAVRLTARMQEHESYAAEVEVRRAKLETAWAAAAREAERAQRTADLDQLRAGLARDEARIEALAAARAELEAQVAAEREAEQVAVSCDEALLAAEAELRAVEVEVGQVKEAVAQLAAEDAERRRVNETHAAEVARAVAQRETAVRALAEAQERLTVAAEGATAAARARESAEARYHDLARTLDAARSDLGAQRAAASQALEAKVAAEADRQALTHEEARRRDTETRLAEDRQRAAAVRETAQRAYADVVARQSSAAAATDAATRTREATEARLREADKALDAAEARLAEAQRTPPVSVPAHPRGRSAGRHILLTLGVGFCLVGVVAWFARTPLLVAAAAILSGLAVVVAGLRAARPAAPDATPERPVHEDHRALLYVVERQVSDLKAQLADARDALTAAKVDEARTKAEFDAARSLGEQLAPALTVAREDEDTRTEAAAHTSASPAARIEKSDEDIAAASIAVNESRAALSLAEHQVTDLETLIAAARDSLTAAKVAEAKTQAEHDNARADADDRTAQLTLARKDEARAVGGEAHSALEEGHAKPSPRLEDVNAELTTRHQHASAALTAAQQAQRTARAVRTEAQSALAKQREAVARLDGEVAQLQLDSRRDRLTHATQELAQHGGEGGVPCDVLDVHVAEEAHEHSALALTRCKTNLDEAKGALRHAGGQATRERLEAQRELVADRRAAFEELEREEKAAYRLFLALQEAEQARTADVGRALAKPVAARFADLTGGAYERVSLDANLTDTRVSFSGATREPGSLSVGAREQLATLVRLALAAQLRTTLLLDDQLVHSDAQRLATLRAQLLASSREYEHQIVVLTCRPADYLVPDEPDVVAIDLAEILSRP
jgi:hypothetical protein